jgi:PAS domain-containing protein
VARVRYDAQALILEANDAAQSMFGRPMVGHFWQEFVTPGSTEQVTVMLEILAEVGAAESRFRMPRPDGSLLEFDSYTEADGDEFATAFRPVPTR